MKSYLILLKMNLRSFFSGIAGGIRKENGKIDIAKIIILICAVLGIGVSAFMLIWGETLLYKALAVLGHETLLIGLAVLLSMVSTLIFGIFHTLASLYFSRDTVGMAHLPVSARAIMAAKWTEIYIPEIMFSACFTLPLLIMYGIGHHMGVLYYTRALLIVLATPLFPLAVSLLLASLLGRITSFTRRKEVWVTIGTILMLVVVLGGEFLLLPQIPDDAGTGFFVQLLLSKQKLINTIFGAVPPILWAIKAAEGSWAYTMLYALSGAAAIAILLYVLGGGYLNVCLRHGEHATREKRVNRGKGNREAQYGARSPFMAIYHREMNEVLKVPVYLLNGCLGTLMLPIMFGSMYASISAAAEEGENIRAMLMELIGAVSGLDLMLIIGGLLSITCWINPIIATAISREGKRLQVSRMIPVPAKTIINAKLAVGMTILTLGVVLMAGVITAIIGISRVLYVLGGVVIALLMCYATSAVSLAVDALYPMLNWKSENHVMKQNMNQIIGMFLCMLMIALAAVPPFLMLSRPAWVRLIVVAAIMLLETAAAVFITRRLTAPRYAALEPA